MKKRLQGFIAGTLSGIILTSGVVFATTGSRSIEVFYNNIKVYKDNVLYELKDSNGTVVEPFIYNGTTYMPVRGTANLAEMDVTWDGATQSIYLWDKDMPDDTYLMDICSPYETSYYTEYLSQNGKSFQMSGQKYTNGFTLGRGNGYGDGSALFNLNSKFSNITFTIGHEDGSLMYDQEVSFIVDGKVVKTIEVVASDLAKRVTIPVNYGLQLKVIRTFAGGGSVGFGNIVVE